MKCESCKYFLEKQKYCKWDMWHMSNLKGCKNYVEIIELVKQDTEQLDNK